MNIIIFSQVVNEGHLKNNYRNKFDNFFHPLLTGRAILTRTLLHAPKCGSSALLNLASFSCTSLLNTNLSTPQSMFTLKLHFISFFVLYRRKNECILVPQIFSSTEKSRDSGIVPGNVEMFDYRPYFL